jgi:hypothetical protein
VKRKKTRGRTQPPPRRRRYTATQVVLIIIALSAVAKELVGLVRDLVKKPTPVVCQLPR